jgi:hypothetical protein
MLQPTPPLRTVILAVSLGFLATIPTLFAAERIVDFRYGIPTWNQPLGIPEDWHKPLANERGALLYDFGPGPYVQGLTVIEAGAEGAPFTFARQLFVEGPRVPIMRSTLTRIDGAMERDVGRMQGAIEVGRNAREKRRLNLKTPVREVVLVHRDPAVLAALAGPLGEYVKEELNALALRVSADEAAWCALVCVPDAQALGRRLGPAFKRVLPAQTPLKVTSVSSSSP